MRQLWYTFIVFATLLTTQIAFSAAAVTDASVDSAAKNTDQKAEQSDQEQEGQNDKESAKEIREGAMELNGALQADAQANQDAIVKGLNEGKASNSKEMMELRQNQADFAARSNAEMAAMMKKIDEEIEDPEVREELKKELLMRRALMAEKMGIGNEIQSLERRMDGGPNQWVEFSKAPDGSQVLRPLTPEAQAGHAHTPSVSNHEVVNLDSIDTQVAALDAQFEMDSKISGAIDTLSSNPVHTGIEVAQAGLQFTPAGKIVNPLIDGTQVLMRSDMLKNAVPQVSNFVKNQVVIPNGLTEASKVFGQGDYKIVSATLNGTPTQVRAQRVNGGYQGAYFNPATNSFTPFCDI